MPEDDDLDNMAQLVAKCDFWQIEDPNYRARIVELTLMASQAADLQDMAAWFRNSKLFDGF